MTVLPDFQLETYFSRWEFRARFNLAGSDVESYTVAELLQLGGAADREGLMDLRLGYTETFGSPALRGAIAATYATLAPDDVLCFTGAQEGIYCAMHALLAPGDHAVVTVPNYQSLEEIPRALASVTGVPLRHDGTWTLDLDELRDALRPDTRLIVINFPNNPTGALIDRATFDAIVRLADEHGAFLLSDEVYRGLEHDEADRLPQAADCSPRALSLGVMSKAYGLPGLRIGWIACRDRAVLQRMERMKHYLSICNSAPSELLATVALGARDAILRRNRAIVAENLVRVQTFMEAHADRFAWDAPRGGCIAFPRYLGPEGVDVFCRAAVEEAGVLLLPNSVFQTSVASVPRDRFRIGYGRRNLGEALGALSAVLSDG